MRNPRALMRLIFVMLALLALLMPMAEAGEFHDWRFREGDSPRTAFGDFTWLQSSQEDEQAWHPFDGESEAPPVSGNTNYVWLRMRLDPTSPDINTLFFVTMNQSFRVWQDEKLVYQYGTLAHQQIGYGWRWHLITLPPDQRSTTHRITFQMYSESTASLGRLMSISIGSSADQVRRLFLYDVPYFINLPVAFMLMVIVGIYYMNQSELRRLYRSAFAFLVVFSVWMFSASNGTVFLLDAPGLWWRVLLSMLYLMPIVGAYIVLELVDERFRPWVRRTLFAYGAVFVVAFVLEIMLYIGIEIPLPQAVENQNGLMIMMPVDLAMMAVLQCVQAYCLYRSEGPAAHHCRAFLVPLVVLSLFAVSNGVFRLLRSSQVIPYLMMLAPFGIFVFAYFILSLVGEQFRKERSLLSLARSLEVEVASAIEQSEIDPLTKCFNRRKFDGSVKEAVALARAARMPLSILMLDIDFFKKVNDTYGHDMGDQVLVNFSDLIRQRLSPRETLFRWGGEEFVVLCRNADLESACAFGEKLRKAVEASSICPVQRITCSIGIASWHGTESDEIVFKRMDEALYAAKQGGRNRVITEDGSVFAGAAPA